MTTAEVTKDRDLLARVAVHNPHLAGCLLRLLNILEDAAQLDELPPDPMLAELGGYLQDIGRLLAAMSRSPAPGRP